MKVRWFAVATAAQVNHKKKEMHKLTKVSRHTTFKHITTTVVIGLDWTGKDHVFRYEMSASKVQHFQMINLCFV